MKNSLFTITKLTVLTLALGVATHQMNASQLATPEQTTTAQNLKELNGNALMALYEAKEQEATTLQEAYAALPANPHDVIKDRALFKGKVRALVTCQAMLRIMQQIHIPQKQPKQTPVSIDDIIIKTDIGNVQEIQFKSKQQPFFGCASYAIRNAGAVQKVFQSGEQLTTTTINKEFDNITSAHDEYIIIAREELMKEEKIPFAKELEELSPKEKSNLPRSINDQTAITYDKTVPFRKGINGLGFEELVDLAQHCGMDKIYFLQQQFDPNALSVRNDSPHKIPFDGKINLLGDSYGTPLEQCLADLNKQLNACKVITNPKPLCVSLCCADENHWRSISVIKTKGTSKKVNIIVLDSLETKADLYGPITESFVQAISAKLQ